MTASKRVGFEVPCLPALEQTCRIWVGWLEVLPLCVMKAEASCEGRKLALFISVLPFPSSGGVATLSCALHRWDCGYCSCAKIRISQLRGARV